jgi:hypothetical protein
MAKIIGAVLRFNESVGDPMVQICCAFSVQNIMAVMTKGVLLVVRGVELSTGH